MVKQDIRQTGIRFTHKTLWRTSQHFLTAGTASPEGSFYSLLAAGTFGFFAFESLLNEMLRQVRPQTWEVERKFFSTGEFVGTLGKFCYLAREFELAIDRSRRPYQGIAELAKARDFLAHGRTEGFNDMSRALCVEQAQAPSSTLSHYGDLGFTSSSLADIESVSNDLLNAIEAYMGGLDIGGAGGAFAGVDGLWHAYIDDGKIGVGDV